MRSSRKAEAAEAAVSQQRSHSGIWNHWGSCKARGSPLDGPEGLGKFCKKSLFSSCKPHLSLPPWASLVAQTVKSLSVMRETRV